MKNQTTRQKSLYITAKLYELAAEFNDNEFNSIILDQKKHEAPQEIIAILRSLMALHATSSEIPAQSFSSPPPPQPSNLLNSTASYPRKGILEHNSKKYASASGISRTLDSVVDIFRDKAAFPLLSDITAVTLLPAQRKEARERYLSRLARRLETLPPEAIDKFYERLSARLSKKDNSFISKWSNLIKDL